jgi:hypothetical protein
MVGCRRRQPGESTFEIWSILKACLGCSAEPPSKVCCLAAVRAFLKLKTAVLVAAIEEELAAGRTKPSGKSLAVHSDSGLGYQVQVVMVARLLGRVALGTESHSAYEGHWGDAPVLRSAESCFRAPCAPILCIKSLVCTIVYL